MFRKFIVSVLFMAGVMILSTNLMAKDYQLGKLTISDPWARASAGRVKTGAAYIPKLANHGPAMDRLVGVSSPVAKKAELHTSFVENGIAKMRHVDGIELKPGQSESLKPGGYHIMLMGLHAPLKMGQSFPLTLMFENAGKLEVTVSVQKPGASHGMKMDHGKMGSGKMKP